MAIGLSVGVEPSFSRGPKLTLYPQQNKYKSSGLWNYNPKQPTVIMNNSVRLVTLN
jgi:hypothetical protein